MKESLVPKHLVLQIREEYRQHRISQATLGKRYGLSETTIHRIVNELGAYQMASPAILPPDELDRLAMESLNDLKKRLAGSPPAPAIPDILLADEKPAGNPDDRLAKEVDKMAEPDRLLDELKKEGSQ